MILACVLLITALVVFTKYFLKHNFKLSFQNLRSRFIFVSSWLYFINLHNFSLQYYLPKLRELIFCEKILKIFFSFLRELIFAKKPTSHISWELNIANFARKKITYCRIFSYEIKKSIRKASRKKLKKNYFY